MSVEFPIDMLKKVEEKMNVVLKRGQDDYVSEMLNEAIDAYDDDVPVSMQPVDAAVLNLLAGIGLQALADNNQTSLTFDYENGHPQIN